MLQLLGGHASCPFSRARSPAGDVEVIHADSRRGAASGLAHGRLLIRGIICLGHPAFLLWPVGLSRDLITISPSGVSCARTLPCDPHTNPHVGCAWPYGPQSGFASAPSAREPHLDRLLSGPASSTKFGLKLFVHWVARVVTIQRDGSALVLRIGLISLTNRQAVGLLLLRMYLLGAPHWRGFARRGLMTALRPALENAYPSYWEPTY